MNDLVLVVDDDPIQRRLLEAQLARVGLQTLQAESGAAAMAALLRPHARRIAAVVLDLIMPGQSGLEVLGEMRRRSLAVPVVVQTAQGSLEAAVVAMRAGAFDFVVKPASPEKLQAAVRDAVRFGREAGATRPPKRLAAAEHLSRNIGPAMQSAIRQAAKAARSTIPVLIEGETGAGKEWLAQRIRASGDRGGRPFVAVNCGALPVSLAESILFGHEKGSFTDASETRPGKFQEAQGGTLFLDEVGELAPEVQVKLLRVLAEGEVDPLGSRAPVKTDVRVISATNRDLVREVEAGRFRGDLYYRLAAFPIRMPALRERRGEIPALARSFIEEFSAAEGRNAGMRLGREAAELLAAYDWPGNIRQLENAVHRAIVLCEGPELGTADFPQISALLAAGALPPRSADTNEARVPPDSARAAARSSADDFAGGLARSEPDSLPLLDELGEFRSLEAVEADLIRSAIKHYNGRMSLIARRLGIGRSTLYRKLREYKISPT